MRTKHLITAMVLPALFAACTAEELVENNATALQGRALLDPNFSISVEGNGVDSRFSWNESAFGWNAFTANDKFSAGLVDDASGTIQDKVLTNYIFSSEDAVNYTTNSQMVEGAYFFYSYPGFETSAARAEVPFNLTSQVKVDLNNPTATVEANQLFVSPIYTLKAKNANEKLPLYFISYWSTAAVKVKNTSGNTMKIRRITLTDATAKFAVKGKLSPAALKTNSLVYTWSDDANAYVLPKDIVKENLKLAAIHDAAATKQDVVTVDCQAYELANGEEALAYIQVPAGRHASVGVDIVVEIETSLGTDLKNVKFDMVANSSASGTPCVDFKRGHTIPVYGIENGGVKAFTINKIVLASAESQTGEYADTYAALESIVLNNNPVISGYDGTAADPIVVNNLGALQLNDDVMYLLNQTNKVVKFMNEIEVTSEGNGVVKNAQFAKGAKVIAGNITFKSGVVLAADQTLVINEEATATIADGTWNNTGSKIVNNGILTLAKDGIAITNIENSATKGHLIIAANVNFDDAAGVADVTSAKSLVVNANKTLTILTPNIYTINEGQSATVNGVLNSSFASTLVNKATLTINGSVQGVTNMAAYTGSAGTTVTPTINNYGKLTAVANDALIDQKSATAEVSNVVSGTGSINNTNDGIVTGAGTNAVYAEYTGDQTGKLGNVMGCTKVILTSGIWTTPSVAANVTTLSLDGVTLNSSDATITFGSVTDLSMKNSTANKNVTFGTASTADMTKAVLDGSTFNKALTLTGLTTLNLRSVTFNGTVTASSVTALTIQQKATDASASNIATTKVNAAMTIAGALTVEQYANLSVTTIGSITGVTTITNNGAVVNKGSITSTTMTAGSKPGTWSGNGTI